MAVFAADFPSDPDVDPGVGGQWTHPETGVVYEWDGVAWNIAGGSGSEGGGTPPGGGGGDTTPGGGGGDTIPGGPGGDPIDLSGDVEIGTDCSNGSLTVHSPATFECGIVSNGDVLIDGELNVLGDFNISPNITNDVSIEGNVSVGTNCGDYTLEVNSETTLHCKVQAESSVNVDGKLTYKGNEVALLAQVIDEAKVRHDADEALGKRIDAIDGYDDQEIFDKLNQETLERKEADGLLNAKSSANTTEIAGLKRDLREASAELSDGVIRLTHTAATKSDLAAEAQARAVGDARLDEQVRQNATTIAVNSEAIDSEVKDRIASDNLIKELAKQHFDEINRRINVILDELAKGTEGELVAYDDTFIREMLEAEKAFRVQEDNKLSERIDATDLEVEALKLMIIVSPDDPIEAGTEITAGCIWHRYNVSDPALGSTFMAVQKTADNPDDGLIWITFGGGASTLDELNDVKLDLMARRIRRTPVTKAADLGEGHFEENGYRGSWTFHADTPGSISSVGGWFTQNNPNPAGGDSTTDGQELVVATHNSDNENLLGQFSALEHGDVVLVKHESLGDEFVLYPIAAVDIHALGGGYTNRSCSLLQLDTSLAITPTGKPGDFVSIKFGQWVSGGDPIDPPIDEPVDPDPGVDPFIDCFLGYDAKSKLWTAKLIEGGSGGGTCIVAQEDPLGTHSNLQQGTIWHQIEDGASPDSLRDNDVHNTFVLVDAEDGSQFWSKTAGAYLSTSGGTVEGRVVIDNGEELGSPFTVMGNIEKDSGDIERGKLLNVGNYPDDGDTVFYRGQITKDNSLVNKKYVDTAVLDISSGNVRVPFDLSAQPPADAADGTLWFPGDENSLKVRYDGNWVPAVTDPYSGNYLLKEGVANKIGPFEIRVQDEHKEEDGHTLFSLIGTYDNRFPSDQAWVFKFDRHYNTGDRSGTQDSAEYRGRISGNHDLVNKRYVDNKVDGALGNVTDKFLDKTRKTKQKVTDSAVEQITSTLKFGFKNNSPSSDSKKPQSFFNYQKAIVKGIRLGNANTIDKNGVDFHGTADPSVNGKTKWQEPFRLESHNIDDVTNDNDVVLQQEIYDRVQFTEYFNVAIRPNATSPSGIARDASRSSDRTVIKALRYTSAPEHAALAFYGYLADPDDDSDTGWGQSLGGDKGNDSRRAANKGYVDRKVFKPGDSVCADSDSACSVGGLFVDGDRVYIKIS